MKRLRAGPLLQSILDHFNGFIRKTHRRKMLMYSGHDVTISGFLDSLDLFNPPFQPPYASMIIIELKNDLANGQYFINMAYRNDSSHDLVMPNCEFDCPLYKFDNLTKHLRPEDLTSECQIDMDLTRYFTSSKGQWVSRLKFPLNVPLKSIIWHFIAFFNKIF